MKLKIYQVVGLSLGLIALLSFTNPQRMPLTVLILPFILVFLILWISISTVLRYFSTKLSVKKQRTLVSLLAAFPLFCLLLQSIGQFSIRDFITLTAFFIVLWFYINRTSLA